MINVADVAIMTSYLTAWTNTHNALARKMKDQNGALKGAIQMKTVDLDTWEQKNIECLTSRGMGAWLHRRDNRVISDLLYRLRNEITMLPVFDRELVIETIDKHLKEAADGNS